MLGQWESVGCRLGSCIYLFYLQPEEHVLIAGARAGMTVFRCLTFFVADEGCSLLMLQTAYGGSSHIVASGRGPLVAGLNLVDYRIGTTV